MTGPCHLIVWEGDPKEGWAGTKPSSAPDLWSLISGAPGTYCTGSCINTIATMRGASHG